MNTFEICLRFTVETDKEYEDLWKITPEELFEMRDRERCVNRDVEEY